MGDEAVQARLTVAVEDVKRVDRHGGQATSRAGGLVCGGDGVVWPAGRSVSLSVCPLATVSSRMELGPTVQECAACGLRKYLP